MSAQEKRICRTCGAVLAAQGEFCPVCAFRGALESDKTATAPSEPEPLATCFGHYEILRHEDRSLFELGRGAMGITYKAFDVDLRRFAALKVISPRYLADEAVRSRFLREARAAGSVRHPNVASVFQLGTSQENYFYAMEFVEGDTLGSLIKRSICLDAKLALEIVAQVAAGLDAIHKQSLVHRDIKPSNIMFSSTADGALSVKIIDLGLAKTLTESESQAAISMPGVFAGTPEFASPEQFRGTDVDIRSDLYSLGITLWQMLTGQPPFRGAPNAVMHQHLNTPLPLEKLHDVPQPVVALVEVLLRKDPARRFQTPAELSKVLPTVIGGIESGQLVRKTIRVFVSSSSELQTERNLANRIVRAIAGEFDLPLSESGSDFQRLTELDPLSENDGNEKAEDQEHEKFALCLQFWDYSGQGEIRRLPDPGNFDLVVCLLGNQVGFPVHPDLRLPDGGVPASGTEYEIAWAAEHACRNHGLPVLRVYRNKSKLAVSLEPRPEREASVKESDSEPDFLAEWEDKRKGTTDFNRYKTLEEFEEQFRTHFRDFVADQIKQDTGPKLPERRVRRWKSSPFRGLNVFDFEHAPIFFGRIKAIGEVLEALEQQGKVWRPFVLIVGGSGSGKSSLVRAGVLPQLTQPGTIEGIGLWRRAVTRPGAGGSGGDCFDALANALLDSAALPGLENLESTSAVEELATELRDNPEAVALRVRDALDTAAREWTMQRAIYLRAKDEKSRSSGTTTVSGVIVPRRRSEAPELPKARLALAVDQLEELFTSGFSTDIQEKYVATIAGLVQSRRVFILATLRSDFYSSYQQFPELTELTRPSGKVDLRPPTAYEIGNMIRLPTEAAGLQFELDHKSGQRLDEGLRDAASTTPESLPLLQHVLSLLYDKQVERGDDLLRWSDYRELGELKGALAKYAETVFATLQSNEQLAFPLVMRHLVTLGQGEEEAPNRRTAPYSEFVAGDGENGKSGAKGFVDLFIAKRLFIADTDPHGEVNVSVAHEALLREWQRIREWLTENRDFLRMRDRLDSSLKLWLGRGKQTDDLLGPGLPLAEGEKLVKDFRPSLSREQADYVSASIAEQERRKQAKERIRYAVMASITAALVAAVIFALVSFRQYRRADEAATRATLARNEAEKLINFMTIALRDKLKPIGRLDLLNEVNQRVQDYYKSIGGADAGPEIQRQQNIALVNYGDVLLDQGRPTDALKPYQAALEIRRKLVHLDQKNPLFQADLAVILQQIGNAFESLGDLGKALESNKEALDIRENLVSLSPQNLEWRGQLARSFEKVGLNLRAQGDSSGALKNFRESLEVATKLKEVDPKSTALQSEIWLLNVRVGEALDATKDPGGALKYYRQSLLIAQGLNTQDPDNTEWQRDIGISEEQIGEILSAQGELIGALDSYKRSSEVRENLFKHDKTNALWEEDLAFSDEDLGNIFYVEGDLKHALESYRESLSHRETLAERDPKNAGAQRDLEISAAEIGSVLLTRGDFLGAWENCTNALQIARKLAEKDQNNKQCQEDLAEVSERAGDILKAQGNFPEALELYQNAMSIRTNLVSRDARWQMEVAKNEEEIADVLISEREYERALELTSSAVKRGELLSAQDQDDTEVLSNLAASHEKLGEALVGQGKPGEALLNFRNSLRIFDRLLSEYPNHADWESGMAFTCIQIAETARQIPGASQEEIRTNLTQARNILLRKKQRFALGVVDEGRLDAVEDALRDSEGH